MLEIKIANLLNREELVAEFHKAFKVYNLPEPNSENVPDDIKELRINLIQEELNELKEALEDNNDIEVLDALCDLQYVLSGTILQLGYSKVFENAFQLVHASNMTKICATRQIATLTIEHYIRKSEYKLQSSDFDIIIILIEDEEQFMVKRKSDGKVMKSVGYIPVTSYLEGILS